MSKTQKQMNDKANKVKAVAEEYAGWGDALSIQVEKYTPGHGWQKKDDVSVAEAVAKHREGWFVNFMVDWGDGRMSCLRQLLPSGGN
jgi:hypothetical protein